jgi:hypothetical protein
MRPAVDLNLIDITPSFWLSATPILPARTPSAISFSGPSGAVGELGEAGAWELGHPRVACGDFVDAVVHV